MAVGRINGVAALTGFYYQKMYGHFAGRKKSGRNNEVTVLLFQKTKLPSTDKEGAKSIF